jgi:N-acetylglutamate synthase-like GNAT family acetyltransferase
MHVTTEDILAHLDHIRAAPPDGGTVEMIVRRPAVDQREVLDEGTLDTVVGLVGDTWSQRPSGRTPDGSPHPEMQLNIMNARVTDLLARHRDRWALAGDQLYLDLDLSSENLPPGTQIQLGTAIIEVTAQPHTGCAKFTQRFGLDAHRFVNSPEGRALNMRGINARVLSSGTVRPGNVASKLMPLIVRSATADDAAAICDVIIESIAGLAADVYDLDQLDAWQRGFDTERCRRMVESSTAFVATTDGRVVAVANLLETTGEIGLLYVHPDTTKRGAPRLLLEALERSAQSSGLTELTTDASVRAVQAFERLGFAVDRQYTKSFNGQDFSNTLMRKPLISRAPCPTG